MDELLSKAIEIGRGMWRRRWVGVAVGWLVGIAGALVVMSYPNRYMAVARMYVDTKTVLRPLMTGLVVEPNTDLTVWMLSKTLITRPNIERLVQSLKLDAEAKDQAARDAMYMGVMNRVKIANLSREGIYDFSYHDTSPERARLVVQGLVSMFIDTEHQTKQRDATRAREFLEEQVKENEEKLVDAENRLKDFKLRHLGSTAGRDYFQRITAVEEELNKVTLELRAAEQSRDALKRELSDETATLAPDLSSLDVFAPSDLDPRLDAQRKQLDELLRRYTELHPDVIATRRTIARLEEQKAAELEARQRAAQGKPRMRSQTEAMQRGKLALAEAEANVASLRFRAGDAQTRMNQLRAAANKAPQIEAEFAQLTRELEIARRNYEGMVARRDKAALSAEAEMSRSEQFRLIDPPRTSKEPMFPSRWAMSPFVVVLALFAGVIASALCDRILPTFDSTRALRLITNRPVLGSVSLLVTPVMHRRSRRMNMSFGASVAALLLVGLIWVRWVGLTSLQT